MTILSAAFIVLGMSCANVMYGVLQTGKQRWGDALRYCIVEIITVAAITFASYNRQPTVLQTFFIVVALVACCFLLETVNGKRRWLRALDNGFFVVLAGVLCVVIPTSL